MLYVRIEVFAHAFVIVVLTYWARLAHPFIPKTFSGTGGDPIVFDLTGYELYVDYGNEESGQDFPAEDWSWLVLVEQFKLYFW